MKSNQAHPRAVEECSALSPSFDAINEYYDRSWFDYWFVWLNRKNLAVHFGYYDEQHTTHAQALVNLNKVLARHAKVSPGDRVLDAGCGVGGSSIWLAENRDANVVGIAPVQSQLINAKKSIHKRGVTDKVHVVRADYSNTCFPDQCFDVVWAMESLCHAPSKEKVYKEFYRILKPGGRLVIAEYMRTARPLDETREKLVNQWLSSWAIPDIDSAEEHEKFTRKAGFTNIVNRDVTQNMEPSLRRLYKLTFLGKPVDRVLKKIGLRQRSDNVDGARLQYEALKNGSWYYSIFSAQKDG